MRWKYLGALRLVLGGHSRAPMDSRLPYGGPWVQPTIVFINAGRSIINAWLSGIYETVGA